MAAVAPASASASAAAAADHKHAIAGVGVPTPTGNRADDYQEVLAVYARGLFTGGALRQPIRMHLTRHPLAHTPIPARLHEASSLRVSFAGIPLDDLSPARGHTMTPERTRAMLVDYGPMPREPVARMRKALLDAPRLLNGFRSLLATLMLGATPVLKTRYNPAFYMQRTAWLADAMRMQLWVGVSVATGRIAQRRPGASTALPRYMLWCGHSSENFGEKLKTRREEATQKARVVGRAKLDEIVTDLVSATAMSSGAMPSVPAAASVSAAAAAAAPAASAEEPLPRTLSDLGNTVASVLCDERVGHAARLEAVQRVCCGFAARAVQRAVDAPEAGIGAPVRETLAAFLLALYAEAPQLCPNYPLHVPLEDENKERDGSLKTADLNSKRETKRLRRLVHKEFRGMRNWCPSTHTRASATALVANALALVRTKMNDAQRNTASVLSSSCATVHAYCTDNLPRVPFEARVQLLLYDHSQTVHFERPPVPTQKENKLRLPIFYSMASLNGVIEFLCRHHQSGFTHVVSNTAVVLVTRPKYATQTRLMETVLCDAKEHAAARPQDRVELDIVFEADWLVCLGWARHNLYSRATQRNDRELALEIKANAALSATVVANGGIDLKHSQYRPSWRVLNGRGLELGMRTMLFHPDVHTDSRVFRGHETGADPRALRLAELMAVRVCASGEATACPVLGKLATELHEYVLAWLHISSPELPTGLFEAIARATCTLENWPERMPPPKAQHKGRVCEMRNSPRVAMCTLLAAVGVGAAASTMRQRQSPVPAPALWWRGVLRREALAMAIDGGQTILALVDALCTHSMVLAYGIDRQRDARLVPPRLPMPHTAPSAAPATPTALLQAYRTGGHTVAFGVFVCDRRRRCRELPSHERLLAEYEIALRSATLTGGQDAAPVCCYVANGIGDQMAFLTSCLRTSAASAADAALTALLHSGAYDLLLLSRELKCPLDIRAQRALGPLLQLAQLATPPVQQRTADCLQLLRLCIPNPRARGEL